MTELATLPVAGRAVTLRTAVRADVPAVVALLTDDQLGRTRETPPDCDLSPYLRAFDLLDGDPGELLVVAVLVLRVLGDELVARLLSGPRADPERLDPDRVPHAAELRPAVADLFEIVEVDDPVLGHP